ncbi:MAG: prenyltransferase/squalene oxidase repeat-containing protein [Anaerolineae bacterium]
MDIQSLWECAERGAAWLIAQQNEDGGYRAIAEPVADAYYKSAWALGLLGKPAAAHRSLSFARRHLLQPNGDVAPRGHLWHREVHYLYANAYFVLGGVRLGRYDVSEPALRFLLSQQSPVTGAFASAPRQGGMPLRYDAISTAAGGLACLAAGRVEQARAAAKWLGQLLARQPEIEAAFYGTVSADGNLVTRFSEDEAPWRVVRTDRAGQTWYIVGLPFAFLVLLAQATSMPEYLEAARNYLTFQESCVEPWSGPSSGKAGWGCAALYRMTGEQRLREIALRIGRYMAGFQLADGSFSLTPVEGDLEKRTLTPADFDLTAEYALWLGEIAANIG